MSLLEQFSTEEQLLYKTKPHWVIFMPAIFWSVLLLLILIFGSATNSIGQIRILNSPPLYKIAATLCFITAAFYGASAYIQREFTEYSVTTKRVLVKSGLIHRKTIEIMARKIEGIQIVQSPWGRILNYGSIIVVGIGGSQDPLPYIPSPNHFRQKVQIIGNT